jgi:hypothetical protein
MIVINSRNSNEASSDYSFCTSFPDFGLVAGNLVHEKASELPNDNEP